MYKLTKIQVLILILSCEFGGDVHATTPAQAYQIGLDTPLSWQVAPPSKLECQMSQEIPRYGKAVIRQQAGQGIQLHMEVLDGPRTKGQAQLVIAPPVWRSQLAEKEIGAVPIYPGQHAIQLTTEHTRRVVAELEAGWWPTFKYSDWRDNAREVHVKLVGIQFRDAWTDFLGCLQNLLSYGFEDIQQTILYYGNGKTDLTLQSRAILQRIATYLKLDPSIKTVILKGYSDSVGTRRANYLVSIERLQSVKQYLLDQGIDEDRLDATAYGERQAIGNNHTVEGRAENRRVTIALIR